jgi:hypothetical protein
MHQYRFLRWSCPVIIPKEKNLFPFHSSRRSLPAIRSGISDILPSRLVGLPRQNLNFRVPLMFEYFLDSWLSIFAGFQFFASSPWNFV